MIFLFSNFNVWFQFRGQKQWLGMLEPFAKIVQKRHLWIIHAMTCQKHRQVCVFCGASPLGQKKGQNFQNLSTKNIGDNKLMVVLKLGKKKPSGYGTVSHVFF